MKIDLDNPALWFVTGVVALLLIALPVMIVKGDHKEKECLAKGGEMLLIPRGNSVCVAKGTILK